MSKTTTDNRPELKPINFGAAAIDIGSKMHMAVVNPARADIPVRMFGTFTSDLHDLADWFKACGVTSVAESIGSIRSRSMRSWEQRRFYLILLNAWFFQEWTTRFRPLRPRLTVQEIQGHIGGLM